MLSKKRLLPVLAAILITFIIYLACHLCLTSSTDGEVVSLDDNWDITIDNTKYSGKKLSRFYELDSASSIKRGDKIVMSTRLPDIGFIAFPVVVFRSKYTTLECYIEDTLIYEFGNEQYNSGKFIGKMYHIISIPREFAGKKLTFKMTVTENDPATNIEPPLFGSQPVVEGQLIHSNLMIISTGIFMFVFGVIFLFVSLIFASAIPSISVQIIEALLCMNLGAWLLSYYNMFTLFYYTPLETQVEYFTLYLIVPYCYLILLLIQNIEKKRLFYAAMITSFILTATQFVLHYIFNIHLRVTLPLYHINAVAGYGIMLYFFYKNIKKHSISSSGMIQMLGITAFSTSVFIHLFVYIFDKLHIETPAFLNHGIVALGCLSLAMCMIANYLVYMTHTYAQRQEYASLSHLAYADGLTNLPNRARADKLLKELSNVTTDYCIISIDLNGLKLVNDKFGHPTGDRYIKDFAKVLSSTFDEEDFCGRIGGDEFIVIINDSSSKDILSMLDRMNSALNVMNAIYSEYHRSVSAGFAFRHEVDVNDPHEVYLLADQRMYENKRRMHEELGIHARL